MVVVAFAVVAFALLLLLPMLLFLLVLLFRRRRRRLVFAVVPAEFLVFTAFVRVRVELVHFVRFLLVVLAEEAYTVGLGRKCGAEGYIDTMPDRLAWSRQGREIIYMIHS